MPEPLQRETFVTGAAAGFGAAFGAASAGCWWICLRRRRSRGQEGLQVTAPVDVLRLVRDVQDPGPAGPLGEGAVLPLQIGPSTQSDASPSACMAVSV